MIIYVVVAKEVGLLQQQQSHELPQLQYLHKKQLQGTSFPFEI